MTTPPSINYKLNSATDLSIYREIFARDGVVQVPDILNTDTAKTLAEVLQHHTPWRTIFAEESGPVHYSMEELSEKGADWLQEKWAKLRDLAQRNIGYLYHTYPMIEAYLKGWDKGHPLHGLTEFVNSDPFLDVGRALLNNGNLIKAEAHATKFGPGHYLTKHIDSREDGARKAAYVLGLTQDWQPDWGGMLLMLDDREDATKAFLPRFNVLTVFDISKPHLVSQISSFAGADRYSIAGWFRDDR